MSFVFFLFSILTSAAVLALGPIVVHAIAGGYRSQIGFG
jgi:hypothetical protein